jgi:ArsR family transcriptional regulator
LLTALAAGALCVCDLAAVLGMTQSAVSHQLRLLRALGLVRARREGKLVWYALDDDHVRALLAIGAEHIEHRAPERRTTEQSA